MKCIANAPESLIYKNFGIKSELLIDHANGKKSCTMADIKAYKSKSKSISNSQILFSGYIYYKAKIVMTEMVLNGCQERIKGYVITNYVGINVGYSKDII